MAQYTPTGDATYDAAIEKLDSKREALHQICLARRGLDGRLFRRLNQITEIRNACEEFIEAYNEFLAVYND